MKRTLLLSLMLAACGDAASPTSSASQATGPAEDTAVVVHGKINPRLLRRFKPVNRGEAAKPPPTKEAIDLGRMLWFDKRLSRGHDVACETCHVLKNYGVDGLPVSIGHAKRPGRRNAPTVYNSAEHFALFWDGRAQSLEEQALGPLLNHDEMAMTEDLVLDTLASMPEYQSAFKAAYPGEAEPISAVTVASALAAFERGLMTRSRWDDYLGGNESALSESEVEGLRVFLNVGCMACHTGPQVGASMFRMVGEMEPWPNQKDPGRFEVTKLAIDRMVFKVPTLKNITRTAPYFHDGSATSLSEAVHLMGKHQLGIELSMSETVAIITFFEALTGELPTAYIAEPKLPASTAKTPKPVSD